MRTFNLQLDEQLIVQKARNGDLNAFNQLILNYQSLAYSVAFRILRNEDDAADALQTSFLNAFHKLEQLESDRFKSWLMRIVVNRCYDMLRRRKRCMTLSFDSASNWGAVAANLAIPLFSKSVILCVLTSEVAEFAQSTRSSTCGWTTLHPADGYTASMTAAKVSRFIKDKNKERGMNNRIKTIFVVTLFVTGLLSACGLNVLRGSGRVVSEPRAVSGFQAVNFNGFGKLTLVHGDTESLTIETDDNLLPYIKTRVSQGTLTIELGENSLVPVLRPTGAIRYTLTVKKLAAFDLSGAGTVESAGLTADQLTLRKSGAGEIKIDQLKANQVAVEMSGAGTINLTGQVTHQTVEMSGVGSYEAGDLESQTAKVMLSGTGTATVWVHEELDSELSGMGTINYYGSPQTHASASGIGTLQNLGNKD